MQYNGYEIQRTAEGWIIRDSKGNYITSVEDDAEAYEYIDDIDKDEGPVNYAINWYERFEKYCKRLPGKCYPTDQGYFATTNLPALKRFIKPFTEATKTEVIWENEYIGGENYYVVTQVICI